MSRKRKWKSIKTVSGSESRLQSHAFGGNNSTANLPREKRIKTPNCARSPQNSFVRSSYTAVETIDTRIKVKDVGITLKSTNQHSVRAKRDSRAACSIRKTSFSIRESCVVVDGDFLEVDSIMSPQFITERIFSTNKQAEDLSRDDL